MPLVYLESSLKFLIIFDQIKACCTQFNLKKILPIIIKRVNFEVDEASTQQDHCLRNRNSDTNPPSFCGGRIFFWLRKKRSFIHYGLSIIRQLPHFASTTLTLTKPPHESAKDWDRDSTYAEQTFMKGWDSERKKNFLFQEKM